LYVWKLNLKVHLKNPKQVHGLPGDRRIGWLRQVDAAEDVVRIPESPQCALQIPPLPKTEEGVYGKLIARFLRGEMGANDQVDPYLVAMIFAGDRADAAQLIRKWMDEGYLVVADRYVYSNIAFQCAKLKQAEERDRLRDWILEFEFGYNQLPKPSVNLYLNVPFAFTQQQLATIATERTGPI
jgi:hypothetical protein